MTVLTEGSKHLLDKDAFNDLNVEFTKSAASLWLIAGKLSMAAFAHANLAKNHHTRERIKQAHQTILNAEFAGNLDYAFKAACKACTAIVISWKDGEYHYDWDRELWDKLVKSDNNPFEQLELDGLKAFKKKGDNRGGSSKSPVTGKNKFQVKTNDLSDIMAKIEKVDEDNPKVKEILAKIEKLKQELQAEYDSMQARMANSLRPKKETPPEDDKDAKRAELERQLAELDNAA